MTADIKSEEVFFVGKLFMLIPRPDRLPPRCCGCVRLLIEKRNLSGCPIALRYCRRVERLIDAREQLRAISARKIKRARLYETFQHLAIGEARIEPRTKILERSELAALLSLPDSDCHRCLANILDRSEAVTNCGALWTRRPRRALERRGRRGRRRYSFRCKFQTALVDVRRQNGNPHPLAFTYEDRNFFRVIDFVTQQTGHEFYRIMRLKVRSLVTDHAVRRTVTL